MTILTAEEIIQRSKLVRDRTAAILRGKGDLYAARAVELGVASTLNGFFADPCEDDEFCPHCMLASLGQIIGFTLQSFFSTQMPNLSGAERAELLVDMIKVQIETGAGVRVTGGKVSTEGMQRPN